MTDNIKNLPVYDNCETPRQLGFHFPAEYSLHEATWLSWPHKEASWPGKIQTIYKPYSQFIKAISAGERVRINVNDENMKFFSMRILQEENVNMQQVEFYLNPTNDAWCRDYGPAFVINPQKKKKAIVDWGYNAWGNKYPPYDLDDIIPTLVAKHFKYDVFYPGIIMEGGSVEFNGKGDLITSTACLLNPNRNPNFNQSQIENILCEYYGVEQILWVDEGIIGDDTDGHIDDTVRFVNDDTVVVVVEENKADENYALLRQNLKQLKSMRLKNGRQLNIVELPMPTAVIYEEQRLPASYANFYISNEVVVVPVFQNDNDEKAIEIIQSCFPGKNVTGINSLDIIWGLGSFHCLSQQEPKI